MTPAEKSDALFDKIYKELDGYGILPPGHMKAMSKDLSIICVEQIIMAVSDFDNELYSNEGVRLPKHREYYQNVLFHLKNS